VPIAESIAANFSNLRIKNKENIKIGWGTDSAPYTFGNNTNSDQQHRSTEGLVLHDNKNTLQTAIEHQRNTAMDASINDVKKTVVQPHDTHIHTQIYTYFVSTWKRILTVLKEISENWKMKLY